MLDMFRISSKTEHKHVQAEPYPLPSWCGPTLASAQMGLGSNAKGSKGKQAKAVKQDSKESASTEPGSKAPKQNSKEFVFMTKDVKLPVWTPRPTAADPQSGTWVYEKNTNLYPFWYVDRLTAAEADNKKRPINCEYKQVAHTSMQLGSDLRDPLSSTFEVSLPAITNSVVVAKGFLQFVKVSS